MFAVHLNSPGAGMMGSTTATITGSLAANTSLPTNANGDTLVAAATAQDAVSLALVGTITAQVGTQTYNYAMGANAVGSNPMQMRPFLFGGSGLSLEDMAAAPGCDWDYNDHFWSVSVNAVSPPATTVSIARGADAAEGGSAPGTFVFTRTGDNSASLTVFTMAWTGGTNTATAGADYTSAGSATFAAGSSTATLLIHATDDALVEGTEMIGLYVTGGSGYQVDMMGYAASIELADNDAATGRHLVWEGMNAANFGDPFNWSDRDNPMAHYTPTAADHLYFVGGSGNATYGRNADCTLPMSLMAVKGLHLIGSYAGKVITPDNLGVGTLELASGSISQSYAMDGMNDLSITELLTFTGGTLNSSATLGTVHLTGANGVGATANLQPLYSPALTIGSTISVEGLGTTNGGSGLYQLGGNYLFDNDAGDVVNAFCTVQMGGDTCAPQAPQPPTPQPFAEAAVQSKNGKEVLYTIKKDAYGEVRNIDIADGRIQIDGVLSVETGGGKLKVNTTSRFASITVGALAPGTVYTGVLALGSDSAVTVNNGIRCSGTIFSSSSKAGKPDAVINGDVDVLVEGTISILLNTNSLKVNGDVRMDGQLRVKANAAGTAPNILKVTGKLDFGGKATLDVGPVPRNSVLQVWTVATADGGVSDQLPKAGSDTYTVIRSADKTKLQIQLKNQ